MKSKNFKKNTKKFLALRRIQRLSKYLHWTSYEKDMGCGRNGEKKIFWKMMTSACHVSAPDCATSALLTSALDTCRHPIRPRRLLTSAGAAIFCHVRATWRHVAPRGNIPFAGAAPAQPKPPATRPVLWDRDPPAVALPFDGPRRLVHAAGDNWPKPHARVALTAT